MTQKTGKAGKSTYQMAEKRHRQGTFYLVLALGAVLIIYLIINNSHALGLSGGAVLVLLLLLRIIPDFAERKTRQKDKEERRAIRGAQAEERVESLLDELGEGYWVMHDVESPYGNIDHLVISQESGIFLVETKAHSGQVTQMEGRLLVNGHDPEKDFIAQCLRNTYWVRDQVEAVIEVKPWITPLLVFTNAFVRGPLSIKGVRILNKKYLLTTIQSDQSRNNAAQAIWENREIIEQRLLEPALPN